MATPTVTNLKADWKEQTSEKKQVQLTNPGDADATTVNDTILTKACEYAALKFEQYSGFSWNDDNPAYRSLTAIYGVEAMLLAFEDASDARIQTFLNNLFTEVKNRFSDKAKRHVQTNSKLTNTSPAERDPFFDHNFFDDMRPK